MKKEYFLISGFLFLSLIGLILKVFQLKKGFYQEIFLIEIFILLSIIISIGFYKEKKWGESLSFIFFLLYGLNLLILLIKTEITLLMILLTILTVFGINFTYKLITKKNLKKQYKELMKQFETLKEEEGVIKSSVAKDINEQIKGLGPKNTVEDEKSSVIKALEEENEKFLNLGNSKKSIKEISELEKDFKKIIGERIETEKKQINTLFVGSKNSDKYHVNTCGFTKKIKSKDKIVFNNKSQATKKGYKAHICVK